MSDLGEHIGLHSDELRTFCTALTSDAEEAEALASRAAEAADSRAVRRGEMGADVAVWRAAVHEYVASRSDRKQARVRAVRVLRELENLEPRDIAPLVGRRPRWVSRQLARTPMRRPDGLDAAPLRRTRRRVVAALAALLLLGTAATGFVVSRGGKEVKESVAAPTVPGLLPWAARGELAGDRRLHEAATKAWHTSDSQVKRTYVLWAGHASGGRLIVLQATAGVERLVAIVADGDRGLHLLRVGGVPDAREALVVEYGGPVPTDQGVDGTALRTLRLLVAPGTTSADRRGVLLANDGPDQYAGFSRGGITLGDWRTLTFQDGLSAAWLEPLGGVPLTAVRFGQRTEDAQLVPAGSGVGLLTSPVAPWSGAAVREATDYPAALKTEESLALAQILRSAGLDVRVVDPGNESGSLLYAVRRADSGPDCVFCMEVYSVWHGDPNVGQVSTTRIESVNAIVSAVGTIVIQEAALTSYRLLGPIGAARCVFGTRVPRAPTSPESPMAVIDTADYDGSYVCVDARGKVVDLADRNTGFATAG